MLRASWRLDRPGSAGSSPAAASRSLGEMVSPMRPDDWSPAMLAAPLAVAPEEPGSITAILAAARLLFHSPGYAVTRVADIAHQAGVSRATVYNHFGGK